MSSKLSVKRHGLIGGRVSDDLVENRLCEYLADWGFSVAAIVGQTSRLGRQLTPCQIGYRMRKKNQKLANYRNGGGAMADNVIKAFNSQIQQRRKRA